MIFLEVSLNNIYQFKNFKIDFTYSRKTKHSPVVQSLKNFPKINYKKINILLGANASGKSTFGKALLIIQHFIRGNNVGDMYGFDKMLERLTIESDERMEISTIFTLKDKLYNLEICFDEKGLLHETWQEVNLAVSASYSAMKKHLFNSEKKAEYVRSSGDHGVSQSAHLNNPKNLDLRAYFSKSLGYHYTFSGDYDYSSRGEYNIDILKQMLKSFDLSIDDVVVSKDDENRYVIEFQNGHKEYINHGKLTEPEASTLSTGTKEAIFISNMIYQMCHDGRSIYYIDEKMTHSHSDIEREIIQIMISLSNPYDRQLFITSHNTALLHMEIPTFNFTVFKKDPDGFIRKVINPENSVRHRNRPLRKMIEEDAFGVAPSLSELLTLHSTLLEKQSKHNA